MKIYKEIIQGTPEWFAIRKLKMTASHAQAIAAQGKGLDTYIYDIVAEYLSSGELVRFVNEHTERGNKLEAEARSVYEFENDVTIEQVGFVELDEYVGCSPDGLIGTGGGLQLKCKMDREHLKQVIYGDDEIDSAHVWQMQMEMLVTGRKWWDYVCYNPNFKKKLYVKRFYADLKKHEQLMRGLEIGKTKINEILTKYNQ